MTRDLDLDAQTLEACRRGDRGAFRLVFDAYRDRVYSLALHFSGNESSAKDITQQVFLTLFTHVTQFRGQAQFATWLYRVVINACIDEHRRQRRYLPEEVAPEPVAGSNQEETCANREVAAYVQAAAVVVSVATGAPSRLETAALAYHREHVRGAWPSQIAAGDPAELRRRIEEETGLHLAFAVHRPETDTVSYRFQGARLASAGTASGVALAFRIDDQPATLLTVRTRDLDAKDAPGAAFRQKRIAYRTAPDGTKILTWTRDQQSYALVSQQPDLGQAACLVCHTDPKRQRLILGLKVQP